MVVSAAIVEVGIAPAKLSMGDSSNSCLNGTGSLDKLGKADLQKRTMKLKQARKPGRPIHSTAE